MICIDDSVVLVPIRRSGPVGIRRHCHLVNNHLFEGIVRKVANLVCTCWQNCLPRLGSAPTDVLTMIVNLRRTQQSTIVTMRFVNALFFASTSMAEFLMMSIAGYSNGGTTMTGSTAAFAKFWDIMSLL